MDNVIANFTSLEGRIGRQSWWIGVVILVVANIVISLLILPLIGLNMMPNIAAIVADPSNPDPAAIAAAINSTMQTAAWIGLVVFLIFAYPFYALSVKRRHDKDNNGLDVLIFMGVSAVAYLLQALGLTTSMTDVGGMALPTPNILGMIAGLVQFVLGIYLLVVLGFLKGTAGPNQYGPDPLGGPAA